MLGLLFGHCLAKTLEQAVKRCKQACLRAGFSMVSRACARQHNWKKGVLSGLGGIRQTLIAAQTEIYDQVGQSAEDYNRNVLSVAMDSVKVTENLLGQHNLGLSVISGLHYYKNFRSLCGVAAQYLSLRTDQKAAVHQMELRCVEAFEAIAHDNRISPDVKEQALQYLALFEMSGVRPNRVGLRGMVILDFS